MISVSSTQVDELAKSLKGLMKKVDRNLATAINATAKKTTTFAARELRKELKVPVNVLKKILRNKARATPDRLQARITVWTGYPIPLKYFSASQTKKGVTYRISPKQKGKMIYRDAFIAKQYGGNVYRRVGKERGPLQKIFGPSPGAAFAAAGLEGKVRDFAQKELPKQIDRRIRLANLREAGVVKKKTGV